jgi:hypothetical protein
MVYLYGVETFALAMLVHYTMSRSCTIAVLEGVAVAVSMLGIRLYEP